MSDIQHYMTTHHRDCDEILADAESPLAEGDWAGYQQKWRAFVSELLHHLTMEEEVLFPAFEQATGITQGPTMVMRSEHEQMRAFVAQMEQAIASQDQERAMGLVESLVLLIQQHNMKEEQMLYPMCDMRLPDNASTLAQMQSVTR
ncbi:hemerythrin domain-containing protein [Thalassotalea sp. M1531]|uniref:Hemerythrin domain-containing protein n=1 Tax=Thalassotalea algicola TaxID=2716224 RepID=A0A7Y0LA63_9GAMM|nr:hemerythrin domain-containing protein [Thalassotalea algicola]NMP30607.1 hemerythrin domain-containing protein [Thalassotalea algicola]